MGPSAGACATVLLWERPRIERRAVCSFARALKHPGLGPMLDFAAPRGRLISYPTWTPPNANAKVRRAGAPALPARMQVTSLADR